MKKIIATVLAMVMALALCTTAFADIPLWTGNDSTANVDLFDGKLNTKVATGSMTFHTAKAPVVTDNALTKEGNVAYYTFTKGNEQSADLEGNYVLVNSIPADADATNYVLVKATDETINIGEGVKANQSAADQTLIMKKVTAVKYAQTATVFTAWGDLCGQYKKPANADEVTYVSFKNALVSGTPAQVWATLSAENEHPNDIIVGNNVLVGSEVYTVVNGPLTAKPHTWAASAWDKDGAATEYKCTTCKTVAKVINASVNAPAGSTVEKIGNTLIAFTYTPGTAASGNTGSASSPKTFDAGIAMYVGMALTSVAGSALVIGKKKEF